MVFQILIILWHSALVIVPFVVSRYGVQTEAKKATGKFSIRSKIWIYGQCVLTAIILTAFMFGRSGDEDDTQTTTSSTEIGSAFIVSFISAIVASFYEINKHNNKIDDSKL